MISDEGLLYIEPSAPASATPLIDHLTRKMTAAFRSAGPSPGGWCGVHECVCGAVSTNRDYRLPSGETTNSLCVHYVAHHRSEVPPHQLARITAFTFGEIDPNDYELQGPDMVLARVRAYVENGLGAERLGTWTRWGLDVERLARSLQGGRLPGMLGYSPARQDAEGLLELLCSIDPGSLWCIRTAVEQDHADVQKWGEQALRVPGWDRERWVSPLVALIRQSTGIERRCAAMNLRLLGTAAATAVPPLMELARREEDDRDLQYDLSLALRDLGTMLGVSLLDQLPPRPGQVGTCDYCQGSGNCYCKRKGAVNADRCPRCNDSGKCHVCGGTGRISP
jgi:hypothetical protein